MATQIGSTVRGLGTAGYLSTGFSNLIANTFTTSTATLQFITTSSIVFGTGTGYLTLPNSVIPNLSVGIIYASTIVGFAPGGGFNVSSLVSTPNLANLISTANLANLISTANLFDLVSTANLADLVSTSYLLNGIEFSSLSNETARLNFSSIFVNNVPILFDQYGNLSLSFQTL